MCKIIAILNQKGGSGKTTLATNISRALKLDGNEVLLVDSDPQGSARDWNAAGEGKLVPVVGLDRKTLAKDIEAVKPGKDFIVIDGAPSIEDLSVAAIKCADIIIIPVQPSPYDVWACSDLVEIIKARQEVDNGKLKAAFVVSRSIKNTVLSKEITKALTGYELSVLKSFTSQRTAFAKSATNGLTVFETESKNSSAINEILSIKNEILELLK